MSKPPAQSQYMGAATGVQSQYVGAAGTPKTSPATTAAGTTSQFIGSGPGVASQYVGATGQQQQQASQYIGPPTPGWQPSQTRSKIPAIAYVYGHGMAGQPAHAAPGDQATPPTVSQLPGGATSQFIGQRQMGTEQSVFIGKAPATTSVYVGVPPGQSVPTSAAAPDRPTQHSPGGTTSAFIRAPGERQISTEQSVFVGKTTETSVYVPGAARQAVPLPAAAPDRPIQQSSAGATSMFIGQGGQVGTKSIRAKGVTSTTNVTTTTTQTTKVSASPDEDSSSERNPRTSAASAPVTVTKDASTASHESLPAKEEPPKEPKIPPASVRRVKIKSIERKIEKVEFNKDDDKAVREHIGDHQNQVGIPGHSSYVPAMGLTNGKRDEPKESHYNVTPPSYVVPTPPPKASPPPILIPPTERPAERKSTSEKDKKRGRSIRQKTKPTPKELPKIPNPVVEPGQVFQVAVSYHAPKKKPPPPPPKK